MANGDQPPENTPAAPSDGGSETGRANAAGAQQPAESRTTGAAAETAPSTSRTPADGAGAHKSDEKPEQPDKAAGKGGAGPGADHRRRSREQRDERSFQERVAAAEREKRQRTDSLRSLQEGGLGARAGRDWIGTMSTKVSGGSLHYAFGDMHFHQVGVKRRGVRVDHMPAAAAERLGQDRIASIPSLAELRRAVEHKSLILVRGADGTGRLTAALVALLGWSGLGGAAGHDGESAVGVVRIDGPPGLIDEAELRPRHGYVLDVGEHDWNAHLENELGHLTNLATRTRCRLILLVPEHRPPPPGPVVEHRPPSTVEVFERWLTQEADEYGITPDISPTALRTVTDWLADESSPSKAVEHAYRLVSGLAEGRTADEVLADLPDHVREDVCTRLSERRPILGRCFMASVAVLHGLPEATVSKAALDLARRIDETWKREEGKRPLPTWEHLNTWLEYAGATTRQAREPGGGRFVELRQRARATTTLRVLWEEQPTIREPLKDWLFELGEDDSIEVSVKAAHAVGLLATLDFEVVGRWFLRPWCKSRRLKDQRLAAWALEVAAQDPALEERVRRHLDHLSHGTLGECAVAIRTFGSRIGVREPEQALAVFETASRRLNLSIGEAIADAVSYLYTPATAEMIIARLARWAMSEHGGSRYAAAVAFLRLVAAPSRPWRMVSPSTPEQRGALVDRLVLLWANALTLQLVEPSSDRPRPAVPDAWPVFSDWMAEYDDELALRPIFEGVLRGSEPEWERLRAAFRLHARLLLHRGSITSELHARLVRLTAGLGSPGS
ncbi:hypothetical protein ACFQZM_09480 [Actinomadura fibrosa]|uniref:Uncharacterized protein n=1 Tax=Actinomadura fibrosa TaxID=111802 RepID=A0ABW2XE44_9ACTN|nr:hypothetical protein [Actinomadura fibrosa]